MKGRCGSRPSLARFLRPGRPPSTAAIVGEAASRSVLAVGVLASLALLPLAWVQGSLTRRRVARLPAASAPHQGEVPGRGRPIRVLAIGESSISGVGISRGDESVTAMAARELARRTGRRVAWRAYGLSGATARQALEQLLPSIAVEPVDLVFVAFGVNDATGYRSPAAYSNDLAALVTAVRDRVGEAAVVLGGVAPLQYFPALPWPLRIILGWRSAALQAAAERLAQRLPKLVVERFTAPLEADLFAADGFHPNRRAHLIWGEKIAALALPLVA
jgi:lysophospholipase L1-like esterase